MSENLHAAIPIEAKTTPFSAQTNLLRAELTRIKVNEFINAHRRLGYQAANLDPLGLTITPDVAELKPLFYGLNEANSAVADLKLLSDVITIDILDRHLKTIYCGPIGLDSSSMRDPLRRQWINARLEKQFFDPVTPAQSRSLMRSLIHAQEWELNVQRAYPKAKRFSLEGCESLLPLMTTLVDAAGEHGVHKLFLGMPHRGRLNLLVNLMDVPARNILRHFDSATQLASPEYDLPYHLGWSTIKRTANGDVALTLAHNPSHLESVYPVVLGMTRAYQDEDASTETSTPSYSRCIPIVVHGDAAFAGQGVVMEALSLGKSAGYHIGGTIHIIVNNQIGFTTLNTMDVRSHSYCTDVSRIVDAPVLHVNADYPEAVMQAARIALDYRMQFGSDVVIDLVGYRRHGHSEPDIPEVTQAQLYGLIGLHAPVTKLYRETASTAFTDTEIDQWRAEALQLFQTSSASQDRTVSALPESFIPHVARTPVPAISLPRLEALVAKMTDIPAYFQPHPLVAETMQKWRTVVQHEDHPVDWCFAENLAYATLLEEGKKIRLSGMDVGRGTFMHRHAVWHCQQDDTTNWIPLQTITPDHHAFDIINSPLSEEAALGFEYGYSVATRSRDLAIWEAQFGDFVNGAQIMLDQYICSGEQKWGYPSALTMILPHGYEGVGPEHSCAYLSRFLQLCADQNMRIAYPSTSAQWMHLLRDQAYAAPRKPLVVMAPKAMLYATDASFSTLKKCIDGAFKTVLSDPQLPARETVSRVVLCSGKLFYDLLSERKAMQSHHIALLRIEQLYPFPQTALDQELSLFSNLSEVVWAQEEDKNQGAWHFIREHLENKLPQGVVLRSVSRQATASGARASVAQHLEEQLALVRSALS